MMPSPLIRHRSDTRHSSRLSADNAPARAGPQNWPLIAPQIRSPHAQSKRSRPHPHPFFEPKRTRRPLRTNLPKPHTAVKSP
jgi:hypothetical protein